MGRAGCLGLALAATLTLTATSPAEASLLRVDYSATLTGTCMRAVGCSFGPAPIGFSVAKDEDISAEFLISFVLDTAAPIFTVNAGDTLPGTSLDAVSTVSGYSTDAISALQATVAGVDLLSEPGFGLRETGVPVGSFGTVPGTVLLQDSLSMAGSFDLSIAFDDGDSFGSSFLGSFVSTGVISPGNRNSEATFTSTPLFVIGDDDGVFRIDTTDRVLPTVTAIPLPAASVLLLGGIAMLGVLRPRARCS
ncbi:MAG: VPLPA-CTERM sorting domain-containing protein [Pseudomonadota bacterium]